METATAIDRKISTAFKESKAISRDKSWQEKVDSLLDRMNELNSDLTTLHKLILFLTFEIERDFGSFKESEFAPKELKKMVKVLIDFLNVVYESDLYKGVKTTHHTLKDEVRYLNELINDSRNSKKIDQDPELDALIDDMLKPVK